ncbi:MAG: heme-binding protein [Betaproteobacteria bacterium]|nr:heme-binding protein [Betaproteobacteria bacterium]
MQVVRLAAWLLTAAFFAAATFSASAQAPVPYGAPIGVEAAKKAAAAALAEARKNNWNMSVAVADAGGSLVYFEKMDLNQIGSTNVAIGKVRSAALFKRPTMAFQQGLAGGGAGLRLLQLEGAVSVGGGQPIVVDGKFVWAIGLSGGTAEQDDQCA